MKIGKEKIFPSQIPLSDLAWASSWVLFKELIFVA
jgi:hypothetical protein